MGSVLTKGASTKPCEDPKVLNQKIRILEEELTQVKWKREHESRAHNRQAAFFMSKETEWKRERKRWREEVGKLVKVIEEKDLRIRELEEETAVAGKDVVKERCQMLDTSMLVEHMREEQARREEAVEKWKRLYLAIKTELDELILRTAQGERLWWGAEEEDMMEVLQKELKAKEEMVEVLKVRLSNMEKEGAKKEREIDILRQSLRIMSNTKKAHIAKKKKTLQL